MEGSPGAHKLKNEIYYVYETSGRFRNSRYY
jgi:hypothetical protein